MRARRIPAPTQQKAVARALDNTKRDRQVLTVGLTLTKLELQRAATAICEALKKLAAEPPSPAQAAAVRVLRGGLPRFEHQHGAGASAVDCLACVVEECQEVELGVARTESTSATLQ